MRFLIFDMDGVLVDSTGCHARAYDDLWRLHGIEGPPYAAIAGRPTREVVAAYTHDVTGWTAFKQQRARELLADAAVFADTLPCLEAMRRAGIGMGVATGASRATAEMLLRKSGAAGYLEFLLAAEDVRAGKPDPEVYRTALRLSGSPSGEAAVVEDSIAGLEAAVAAGAPVGCIRSGLRIASPLFLGSFAGLREFSAAIGVEF